MRLVALHPPKLRCDKAKFSDIIKTDGAPPYFRWENLLKFS